MTEYIVSCGPHKFFAGFVNGDPVFTTRRAGAKLFVYEEMAEHVAKRCEKVTGHKYKVECIEEEL